MSYGYSGVGMETASVRAMQNGVLKAPDVRPAIVAPFGPQEATAPTLERVRQLEQALGAAQEDIQQLAEAVRQMRSILGC